MREGYDQALEDALFDQIGWPDDGYRLFEIGHFQGDRDWFDGLWESNCLFVAPRACSSRSAGSTRAFAIGRRRLHQPRPLRAPGVDPRRPGRHHARRGHLPPDPRRHHHQPRRPGRATRAGPLLRASSYAELRGRAVHGAREAHPLRRRLPRRAGQALPRPAHDRRRRSRSTPPSRATTGRPSTPAVPIPDDLRDGFTERLLPQPGLADTPWLGAAGPQRRRPTCVAYQEILGEVRPDWVIETGTRERRAGPASSPSICDLLGHGQVARVVDAARRRRPPDHPRHHLHRRRGPRARGRRPVARGRRRRPDGAGHPRHPRTRATGRTASSRPTPVRAGRLLRRDRAHRAQRLPGRRVVTAPAPTRPSGGS